ncbi:MAG: elongation factor P [Holosporales bacterium]
MKVLANDLRVGHVIELKNRLWAITKTRHVQPGKGGAFINAEMKALIGGTKAVELLRSQEAVEKVTLDTDDYQYLYADGDELAFMHQQTFEQITLPKDILGDSLPFLLENAIVTVQSHEGKVISVMLPETVVLEIVEADPVVKGQTASSSFKPAKLANGERIMVPPHIIAGTKVVVNTTDGSYVERFKE